MSLVTIAEMLVGEALVSPGGPVDALTAVADDVLLWETPRETPVPERDATAERAGDEVFALL
jgi:hypothetical protein